MDPDITYAQIDYIRRLLEVRRVSRHTAIRVIEMLLREPPINDDGMDTLKKIQQAE